MTQALVTGATGFVGSAVARALLGEGIEVVCLARPSSDRRNLAGLDVALATGDLNDTASIRRALAGCELLFHVAAFYSTRPEDADLMWQANVEGTCQVLRAGAEAGVQRIVYTSTIGTIGRPREDRLPTEDDLFDGWETASPYARSKLEAERLALAMAREGLPVIVVNPCAPVGRGDLKPSSTGQRILDYLHGRTPSYIAGGINFVSVEDVAQGHLLAARHGRVGERYILGHAAGNLDLEGFCALMERVAGMPRPRAHPGRLARAYGRLQRLLRTGPQAGPGQGFRPAALTADPSRAIRELGLPQTPLEVAFAEAVAWFRENGYADEALICQGRKP